MAKVISKETIKPSSPTPPHLKTHMLSVLDLITIDAHMPSIFFYQTYKTGDMKILKESLSQTLTHFYTFAGVRPTPFSPHIDCNDEGVLFLEAFIDNRLDDYINLINEQHENLDLLIPNALGCDPNKLTSHNMMEVQLNHFNCGGVALAMSISHKVADAATLANFMNHWANVARGRSPPAISYCSYMGDMKLLEQLGAASIEPQKEATYVTRRFLFTNSKLDELKSKINAMGTTPINPTRVESLSSLVFKCAVDAATTLSSLFQPSGLSLVVNLRNALPTIFSKSAAGNLPLVTTAKMVDSSQIKLDNLITSLRKEIMEVRGVKDTEELDKKIANSMLTYVTNQSRNYVTSSVCGFPYYQVDFGWGKPVRVIFRSVNGGVGNLVALMDAPYIDGIEATIHLEEKEMAIFERDEQLLAYAMSWPGHYLKSSI